MLADIDETNATAVANRIVSSGGSAIYLRLNVTSDSGWRDVITQTVKTYGKLNVLVNNAGISLGHDIEDTTLDEWNLIMMSTQPGILRHEARDSSNKQNGEMCSIINRSSIDGQIGEAVFCVLCIQGRGYDIQNLLPLGVAAKGYKIPD